MSKANILVVDDERFVAEMISERFQRSGFNTHAVTSGQAALDYIKTTVPDLVILDLLMPGMDGYEVCEILKKDPATKDIPVIIITARSVEPEHHKAIMQKADWHIAKPYYDKYLIEKVKEFIKKELGEDVPWHVSRFFPYYKMNDVSRTTVEKIEQAVEIGKKAGLKYVYAGNI